MQKVNTKVILMYCKILLKNRLPVLNQVRELIYKMGERNILINLPNT